MDQPESFPRRVEFFGHTFTTPDEEDRSLVYTVEVEDGDYQGIIDTVREDGGTYLVHEDGSVWFMPWPPAAIRVTPLSSD